MRITLHHDVKGSFVFTVPKLDSKTKRPIWVSYIAIPQATRQMTTWGYLPFTL